MNLSREQLLTVSFPYIIDTVAETLKREQITTEIFYEKKIHPDENKSTTFSTMVICFVYVEKLLKYL